MPMTRAVSAFGSHPAPARRQSRVGFFAPRLPVRGAGGGVGSALPPPIPMGKAYILGEFWRFLRVRKKYWLAPIVFVLVLLSLLIVTTQGSALAPFIYSLF